MVVSPDRRSAGRPRSDRKYTLTVSPRELARTSNLLPPTAGYPLLSSTCAFLPMRLTVRVSAVFDEMVEGAGLY